MGFAGTPDFAARILQGLLDGGRTPAVVYTQPDRPTGRGRRVQPSPVKRLAETHTLPLCQPTSLKGDAAAHDLAAWNLDVLVVAAYGLILPPSILATPRLGCINVHPSLLPRWRGAAPVEHCIMAGDVETGVCIMHMERGLDSGPVYLTRRTRVADHESAPELKARLATLGVEALLEALAGLPDLQPEPQSDAGVTYAHKLTRDDMVLDWRRSAMELERQVRALAGRQGAATGSGAVRVNVLDARALPGRADEAPGTITGADRGGIRVACGDGVLALGTVKLSVGKGRPLSAADAVNGYAALFAPGTILAPAP
ncbi:MAG: methionyl-tRNA formyltransferase [Gammaproteobacteria bacterium]|nr:methionyl-tRNA formyltransferase [Gammaproteobacteria bacterium]